MTPVPARSPLRFRRWVLGLVVAMALLASALWIRGGSPEKQWSLIETAIAERRWSGGRGAPLALASSTSRGWQGLAPARRRARVRRPGRRCRRCLPARQGVRSGLVDRPDADRRERDEAPRSTRGRTCLRQGGRARSRGPSSHAGGSSTCSRSPSARMKGAANRPDSWSRATSDRA